jgi:serine/threonine-protein kinase
MATQGRDARLSTKLRLAPTRYEPIARIAAGGMAEVWRARAIFEHGESHPVAIKRVLPELSADPLYRQMFDDEARLGMLLRHPNIVRIYDARAVGDAFIMIMELVDGAALKALFDHAHARHVGFPVPAALHIVGELARALAYAHVATDHEGRHLGIVHRDVSPHNVLLGRDGAVKLADFGLANASSHQAVASEGMIGGKLGYLAPEVVQQQPTTTRVDVFAAGIVLWEALTGRRLFHGDTDAETVRAVSRCEVEPASRINASVPKEVDALLARALHPDPQKRLPSAQALVEELDALVAKIDREVNAKDVALLVGLFLAQRGSKLPEPPAAVAALLTEELARFVEAADSGADAGAAPLDPLDFSWAR